MSPPQTGTPGATITPPVPALNGVHDGTPYTSTVVIDSGATFDRPDQGLEDSQRFTWWEGGIPSEKVSSAGLAHQRPRPMIRRRSFPDLPVGRRRHDARSRAPTDRRPRGTTTTVVPAVNGGDDVA